MEKLFAAGALDVWFTPIQMKKKPPRRAALRPLRRSRAGALADLIFTETTAFGLRVEKIARLKLERRFETVVTEHGDITIKLGLKQGRILQLAPEFESCRAASERTGQPLRTIFAAATSAARERFPTSHPERAQRSRRTSNYSRAQGGG